MSVGDHAASHADLLALPEPVQLPGKDVAAGLNQPGAHLAPARDAQCHYRGIEGLRVINQLTLKGDGDQFGSSPLGRRSELDSTNSVAAFCISRDEMVAI